MFNASAALAYYTIFSIAPMLIIVISLVGFFYKDKAVQQELIDQISSLVGSDAASQVERMLEAVTVDTSNTFLVVFGIGFLLYGSTRAFVQIQDTINHIWGIRTKPKYGILKAFLDRLLSFSLLVTMSFFLVVSLFVNTIINVFQKEIAQWFPNLSIDFMQYVNTGISFTVITLIFIIIFKVLPDAKVHWKDVITGSVLTAILFMLGNLAIGVYLGQSNIASVYGAAGSLIIIMIWVYYSATILYFGAEFTQVFAEKCGREIHPTSNAVKIERVEKVEED